MSGTPPAVIDGANGMNDVGAGEDGLARKESKPCRLRSWVCRMRRHSSASAGPAVTPLPSARALLAVLAMAMTRREAPRRLVGRDGVPKRAVGIAIFMPS